MKKFLACFLLLMLTIALLPQGLFTFNTQAISSGDYTYTISHGEATITGYSGDSKSIIIPSTLDNYPVTRIGDYAFKFCNNLHSVKINTPDFTVSIGKGAFAYCSYLFTVALYSPVIIDEYAFDSCVRLDTISTTPNSIISIGDGAFYGCTKIGAFEIPASVTTIGTNPFKRCYNLHTISVDKNNSCFSSLDGILFDKEKTKLIAVPAYNRIEKYTIPDSVRDIGDYAFATHMSINSIQIPNSVKDIGDYAFADCTTLTSINIPSTVTIINSGVFTNTGIKSITIPLSVTAIGGSAFASSCLTSIIIPDSVTSIGSYAFAKCPLQDTVTIPDSVTLLDQGVFAFCDELTSITIPDSVTSIGDYAFNDCFHLTSITIPDSVTSISNTSFFECNRLTSVRFYSRNQMSKFDSTISNSYRINENINFLCLCKDDQHTYNQESEVICDKCMFSRAPLAPTVAKVTSDSITLMAVDGYEYKIGDGAWTSDPIFTGLDPATEYTFYQRVAETNTNYVSESSTPFTVETKAYTSGDIDGVKGITDADAEYLLMYTFFPDDYPVNQTCDFNGDGFINDADAEHLLMFTFFPEDYPLQ